MNLGPNLVYECPNCGNLIQNCSLMSGNTVGALVYSDGKRIAPMLPEYPNLTICKKCNYIFWLDKTKEIGHYYDDEKTKPEWLNSDQAEFLTVDEYFHALDLVLAEDNTDELFIRQRIWWLFNDRVRNSEVLFISDDDEYKWKSNIENLLRILEVNEVNHKILIAELYRNIGNFEKCLSLIQNIEDPETDWLKQAFIKECNSKNQIVFQLY
jgi:hypothetical protein